MAKHVLAIGAHPDDMNQFAGGTLILLKKAGYDITIADLTDGRCGSKIVSAEEIIAIRRKEAEKAAEMIGAHYITLGLLDGCVEYNLENATKLVTLIRQVDPEIIITHPAKEDYMTDHWHTGALVLWAAPEAIHINFSPETQAMKAKPYIYHTDPQDLIGSDGQIALVNTIVDISDVIDQKLEALAAHESQMRFSKHREKEDTVDKTKRYAISRGLQIGALYAEGFMQNLYAGYLRKNRLVEILPEKVYTL